ncbi:MAG: caspase family protein [Kofleriaceae bacterium]
MKLVAIAIVMWLAVPARADTERYAVIIGHNTGAADEQRLKFAETDAPREGELLGEIGGIPDENQVVLRGKTSDQVRRALISTNERIRVGQRAGHEAVLVVYYSGHGDADALHLGDTRFALRELEALVRGSSAQVRILVIDSCRSGSVTRVKGGRPGPPLALAAGIDEVPGEGVIVLTASTAGEDAQESDALAGSFFTHYLLSALRGAADDDGDQVITVAEAFAYTRSQTILASSRTLSGTQHPTFHYDLRGRAEIALTDLGAAKGRGKLTLPDDATWIISRGASVVGEIAVGAKRRTLSLRPGTYFVRGRAREALFEGTAVVDPDRETRVATASLERSTYAKLVRKGRGEILSFVSGPLAGPLVQTTIVDGGSPCLGGLVGWTFVRADLALSPRLAGCRGEFSNRTLTATADVLALDLRAAKVWDLSRFAIDLGVTVGGELLQERFTTRGIAPTRTTFAAHLDVGVGISRPIGARSYVAAELAAQTHFFTVEDQAGTQDLVARFALRGVLLLGFWL